MNKLFRKKMPIIVILSVIYFFIFNNYLDHTYIKTTGNINNINNLPITDHIEYTTRNNRLLSSNSFNLNVNQTILYHTYYLEIPEFTYTDNNGITRTALNKDIHFYTFQDSSSNLNAANAKKSEIIATGEIDVWYDKKNSSNVVLDEPIKSYVFHIIFLIFILIISFYKLDKDDYKPTIYINELTKVN